MPISSRLLHSELLRDKMQPTKVHPAYPDTELSPLKGHGGLDEPRSLGDGLRDFGRTRGHQLGLAVLHEGGKAGLREFWKKIQF